MGVVHTVQKSWKITVRKEVIPSHNPDMTRVNILWKIT